MQCEEKKRDLPEGFDAKGGKKTETGAASAGVQQSTQARVDFGGSRRDNHGITEKPQDMKSTLRRLTAYFKGVSRLFALLMAVVIVMTCAAVMIPSLQGGAIDAIKDRSWSTLLSLLGGLLAVYAVQAVCSFVQARLSASLSQRIIRQMRRDLFQKIIRLPSSYLDTHSNGDLISRITNDVENLSSTISQSLGSLLSSLLTIVGTLLIMLLYCWQLTLITMVTVFLTVFSTRQLSKIMAKEYRKRARLTGELNGLAEEMITGYQSVTACQQQEQIIREFDRGSDQLTTVSIRAESLSNGVGPGRDCSSNVGFGAVAVFGGGVALKGMITIGVISAFLLYAKQFIRPVNEVAQLFGSIQTAAAGAERVFALMEQPEEDSRGTLALGEGRGAISFQNVTFSYVPGQPVLKNFSLDIRPGQKIALVGATGSGKTTVVNLLIRFYPVDSGEITIDGQSIYQLDRSGLRSQMAIVLQDTVLFSDTVEGNLKYAAPNVSQEDMERAARISHCAVLIEKLPQGYQTVLTHAGANLSQGQRQLLAIARAILADPRILILDEATSCVDTQTEKQIQDAMAQLMKNRTCLMIAHRLSTIQDADVIVVLDGGQVVETGTHEELLARKGYYHALYMTQFAGQKT
ncbi:MAG: ABC transporter ATP-binding protein/permease [Oscillospiraceae bacterium]|nr:ABC transporter ATP-binding protein/permease [Oscillospiraceae bacterium]